MGAILRLNPTSEGHLGEPQENRKQQEDAPFQVRRLNCFFLSNKIPRFYLKRNVSNAMRLLICYVGNKSKVLGQNRKGLPTFELINNLRGWKNPKV